MTVELQSRGLDCGRHRVARLMREAGIQARQRRRWRPRTTQSRHTHPLAPNLLNREFQATAPNEKWLADISYVATREGWLYLASVLDVYSRLIVGWSMQDRLTTPLVAQALQMALARRCPSADLLHHSDRGSQYASTVYQTLLQQYGITVSMSRTGDCYNNAMMESFFATLKVEGANHVFATRDAARLYLFEFIEIWYNHQRRHSTLGYLSPFEFEQRRLS